MCQSWENGVRDGQTKKAEFIGPFDLSWGPKIKKLPEKIQTN